MKFFAVFSAILAVACASQWTINSLSEAIMDPNTDPAMIPYLSAALNELMLAAMTGNPLPVVSVSTPVQDISSWTLPELSEAIQNPATEPALVPYLEHALNTMMMNLMSGQQQESIIIATPVGLLPGSSVVAPAPVVEAPAVESPVASSPLVQIIVNVNKQESLVPAPAVVPEETFVPVNPVDVIAINPVGIAPVIPVNPVDAIAVMPPQAIVSPVTVVNPVDMYHPVPVAPVNVVDQVVGPIV